MRRIEQKLNSAEAAFASALDALAAARQNYEADAGQSLAETIRNNETLYELIDEQTLASQAARDALKAALHTSNAAMTPEAKAALTARRNADDLAEQYSEMLVGASFRLVETTIAAGSAAKSYEGAYANAQEAQIELVAYAALAQAGQAIAHAIALGGRDIITRELERLAEEIEPHVGQVHSDKLGMIDTGALVSGDRLNPVEVSLIRRAIAGDISGDALDLPIARFGRSRGFARALATVRDRIRDVNRQAV